MSDTEILYTKHQIEERVKELAVEIAHDYKGKHLVLIGVLKGSFVFFADLLRALYENDLKEVVVDFITISSYGTGTTYSGNSHVLSDITQTIAQKEVMVVEDIVDTGHTLTFLKQYLLAKNPKSLKFAVFLDKIERREVEFMPDYIGFTLKGTPWIEGYGLDGGEFGRGRPEIAVKRG